VATGDFRFAHMSPHSTKKIFLPFLLNNEYFLPCAENIKRKTNELR
jgi:hypothetical protein